jgi:hypothetical protein
MSRNTSRWLKGFSALSICAALAACGGGGGDSTSDAGGLTTPMAVNIKGVAAIGPIANATVTAYKIENNAKTQAGGAVFTDGGGAFELKAAATGLKSGDLVVLEVKSVAKTPTSEATVMQDPVSNAPVTLPVGTVIVRAAQSLAVDKDGDINLVQINPYTEMALVKALSGEVDVKNLSAGALKSAIAGLSSQLGGTVGSGDVFLSDPKFDVIKDAAGVLQVTPKNEAAVKLAAIAQMAGTAAASELGCTSLDAGEKLKCVVDKVAITGMTAAVKDKVNKAIDQVLIAEKITDIAVNKVTDDEFVPTPEQKTALETAKALVNSISSNGRSMSQLSDSLLGVQSTLQSAVAPISHGQGDMIQVLAQALNEIDEFAVGERGSGPLEDDPQSVIQTRVKGDLRSGCTVYQDAARTIVATTYANADFAGCRIWQVTQEEGGQTMVYQHQLLISPGAVTGSTRSYAVTSRVIKQEVDPLTLARIGAAVPLTADFKAVGTFTGDRSGGNFDGVTFTGDLAPTISADASIDGDHVGVVLQFVTSSGPGAATRLNLTGTFTPYGADRKALSTVGLQAGSYLQAKAVTQGDLSSGLADESLTVIHAVLDATSATGSQVTGTLDIDSVSTTKAEGDDFPGHVRFVGVIKQDSTHPVINGTLDFKWTGLTNMDPRKEESATNFASKALTFEGTINAPDAKPLQFKSLTLVNPSYGVWTASGQYLQDAVVINFSGSGNQLTDTSSATVSSTSGVSLKLSSAEPVTDITANGSVKVGTLDRRKGRVDFIDGTYQSL